MPWAVEKKAEIKGTQLLNFVIGVAVFIGAGNIIYIVGNFIADVFNAI